MKILGESTRRTRSAPIRFIPASCRRCAHPVAPPIPPCGPNACASFRCAGREKLTRWPTPSCSWLPMSRPTSQVRKFTWTVELSPYNPAPRHACRYRVRRRGCPMSQACLADADTEQVLIRNGPAASSVPTSNTSRRQLAAHPSAALISRVQNFRRKMCRTASAPSSHSRPGDGLFARRTEGSNLARSSAKEVPQCALSLPTSH